MIDRLLDRGGLAGDEEDYLDVLSDLVEKYEDARYPIQPISGLDALRHLVESSGKTQAIVAAEAGLPGSTLSEVLLGRPRLNTRHIGILARYFLARTRWFRRFPRPGASRKRRKERRISLSPDAAEPRCSGPVMRPSNQRIGSSPLAANARRSS